MSDRQYLACAFRPDATRTYTYHNDGEPVSVGDVVRVEVPDGGWKPVTVREIVRAPTFTTRPILGRHTETETANV